MRTWRSLGLALLLLLAHGNIAQPGPPAAGGAARVELEISVDPQAPLDAQQTWHALFAGLQSVQVRLRPARAGDEVRLDTQGTAERPTYQVLAQINARGELFVPGRRFSSRDRVAVRAWIDQLLTVGPNPPEPDEPRAFGLSTAELAEVRANFTQPCEFATKDRPRRDVLEELRKLLTLPLVFEPDAQAALQSPPGAAATNCLDELQGISCGTALSYLLRCEGLALAPASQPGRGVKLVVFTIRRGRIGWPLGERPAVPPRELLPAYFEFLNVELNDVPLARAMGAIGQALQVPVLWDRYALARHQIDPASVRVSVPAKRTAYVLVTRQVLTQAKLRSVLCADEAGHPWLWVTTQHHP